MKDCDERIELMKINLKRKASVQSKFFDA